MYKLPLRCKNQSSIFLTVGYSYHDEYAHIFKTLTESEHLQNEIIYSAHCHDDLGMAVSNSLAAIEGGAR